MSIRDLAAMGRGGDTMLAHINPEEAQLLKALGGSGTINPRTGLREFSTSSDDPDGDESSAEADQGNNPDGSPDSSDGGQSNVDNFGNQSATPGQTDLGNSMLDQQARDAGWLTQAYHDRFGLFGERKVAPDVMGQYGLHGLTGYGPGPNGAFSTQIGPIDSTVPGFREAEASRLQAALTPVAPTYAPAAPLFQVERAAPTMPDFMREEYDPDLDALMDTVDVDTVAPSIEAAPNQIAADVMAAVSAPMDLDPSLYNAVADTALSTAVAPSAPIGALGEVEAQARSNRGLSPIGIAEMGNVKSYMNGFTSPSALAAEAVSEVSTPSSVVSGVPDQISNQTEANNAAFDLDSFFQNNPMATDKALDALTTGVRDNFTEAQLQQALDWQLNSPLEATETAYQTTNQDVSARSMAQIDPDVDLGWKATSLPAMPAAIEVGTAPGWGKDGVALGEAPSFSYGTAEEQKDHAADVANTLDPYSARPEHRDLAMQDMWDVIQGTQTAWDKANPEEASPAWDQDKYEARRDVYNQSTNITSKAMDAAFGVGSPRTWSRTPEGNITTEVGALLPGTTVSSDRRYPML